ncbi:MAG: DMT family transporter [Spirochaetia bacterium]|nr:DMT family transporter [Spirochaetia bacterium]
MGNNGKNRNFIYYLLILITILFWSSTFVSTKILLNDFKPIDLFVYRFILAYLLTIPFYPHFHKPESLKTELLQVALGITGGSLYFLGESYAIKYSTPSNVAIIVATAPLATIFLASRFLKSEKITRQITMGGLIALAGVFMVVYNGIAMPYIQPISCLLALVSVVSWGFYSIILKMVDSRYPTVYITRKTFFWAVVTILPLYFLTKAPFEPRLFLKPENAFNLLMLAFFASTMAYYIWGKATLALGAAKTNNFIYMIPLFTLIESSIILGEPFSIYAVLGAVLILSGVVIAELARNTK